MKNKRARARQTGLLAVGAALAVALAACGGGGGGGASPQPVQDASPQNVANWQSLSVNREVQPLPPGGTYEPIGGNAPYALWLAQQPDGSTQLVRGEATVGARGVSPTILMTGLPAQALAPTTTVVHAGDWTLVLWLASNEATPAYKKLFTRLVGPGADSGVIELTAQFDGSTPQVRTAIDATGNNVVVWDEPGHLGAQGRVVRGNWVRGADLGTSVAWPTGRLVGPDGQGWLFQELQRNGASVQEVRRITAATGVGSAVRLDATTGGPLYVPPAQFESPLAFSVDGTDTFTAVSVQQPPGSSGVCLAVRRMAAGLQQPVCVNVSGDSLPNGNQMSLSSNRNGAAVLVWSAGEGLRDVALYESRRATANGAWSAPALLTRLPVDEHFSLVYELKTGMNSHGQAVVAYVTNETMGGAFETWVLTRPSTGVWAGPTGLGLPGYSRQALQLAFNGLGEPAILQALANGSTSAVLLSTWSTTGWRSSTLKSGFQFAYATAGYADVRLHLAPQGTSGWLAAWLEGEGPALRGVPGRFWLTEYR